MICGNKDCSEYGKEVGGKRYCPRCGWKFSNEPISAPGLVPPKRPVPWKYIVAGIGALFAIGITAYVASRPKMASSNITDTSIADTRNTIDQEKTEDNSTDDAGASGTSKVTTADVEKEEEKSVGLVAKTETVVEDDDRVIRLSEGYGLDESEGKHTWANEALLKDRQIQYSMNRLVIGEDYATYLYKINWDSPNYNLAYDTYELVIYQYNSDNRAKSATKVLFTKSKQDAEIQLNACKEDYNSYKMNDSNNKSWGSVDSSVKVKDNMIVSLDFNYLFNCMATTETPTRTHKAQTLFYFYNDLNKGKALLADGYNGEDLRKAVNDTNDERMDFVFNKWINGDGWKQIKPSAEEMIEF